MGRNDGKDVFESVDAYETFTVIIKSVFVKMNVLHFSFIYTHNSFWQLQMFSFVNF